MRFETRAPSQETAPGLTSPTDPDGGSRTLHALLAEKSSGHEPAKPPGRFCGLGADGIFLEKPGFAAGPLVDSSAVL